MWIICGYLCERSTDASLNAQHGLNYLPLDKPVLLTTSDHALLTLTIVYDFLRLSHVANRDATVGVVTERSLSACANLIHSMGATICRIAEYIIKS